MLEKTCLVTVIIFFQFCWLHTLFLVAYIKYIIWKIWETSSLYLFLMLFVQNNKVHRFCNAIDDWMSFILEVLSFQVRAIIQSALAVSVPLYTSVDHSESLAELTLTCSHCSQSLVFPSQHAPASEGWPFRTGVQFNFSLSPPHIQFTKPHRLSLKLHFSFYTSPHLDVCTCGFTHAILRFT